MYIANSKYFLKYSDNYFDVVPGKKSQIAIVGAPVALKDLKSSFVFKSYREVYDPAPLKVKF